MVRCLKFFRLRKPQKMESFLVNPESDYCLSYYIDMQTEAIDKTMLFSYAIGEWAVSKGYHSLVASFARNYAVASFYNMPICLCLCEAPEQEQFRPRLIAPMNLLDAEAEAKGFREKWRVQSPIAHGTTQEFFSTWVVPKRQIFVCPPLEKSDNIQVAYTKVGAIRRQAERLKSVLRDLHKKGEI